MFSIGEYVVNEKTGYLGKVVGYGHQLFNDVYTTTLKVLVESAEDSDKKGEMVRLIGWGERKQTLKK